MDTLQLLPSLQIEDIAAELAEKGVAVEVTDAALYYTLDESYGRVSIDFSAKF